MRLGDVANGEASRWGKPLEGVRILAAEQMQSLPYATQLLARLGADVVKVEHPTRGDSGRGSLPAMTDPDGRGVGATFLRNNLDKRSVGIDLSDPRGRDLFLELAGKFDVVAENFKAGALDRLGLGYDVVSARWPKVVYLSISGFGNTVESPYSTWPAYAAVAEAMSGLYEYAREPDRAPVPSPFGGLGDIGTALFATIGVLAALRQRDHTGVGQYVDVAMLDSMIALGDVVTNFWSMGLRPGTRPAVLLSGFRAADGWFILQVGREHQFERLADLVGHREWLDDPRFADRVGWVEHLDAVIRPAIEKWAGDKRKVDVCAELSAAGLAAGPCFAAPEVIDDPHVAARNMLVECPRTDDVAEPVLVPGNPIKLSKAPEGPEHRVPWVGEHTDEVLTAELDLDESELSSLRDSGVIT
jgi:formyl-CoA transferase